MEKLTAKEEEIMHLLWNAQKAFIKDLLKETPAPKPHYNTLSTIIRNLEEKGYVGHTEYGGTFEYYPLVSKEQYLQTFVAKMLSNYFDNSYKSLVSFFAQENKISAEELKEILKNINEKED
jgi:BlaI family penicillinase repressor